MVYVSAMDDFMNSEFSSEERPTGERWDPLGAPNDQEDQDELSISNEDGKIIGCDGSCVHLEKTKYLEEEQDMLNSSLFALTTHFAQVQFRLRQIVDAPSEDKEELLKALEEFAFRGIPDVSFVHDKISEASLSEAVRLRRVEQQELIEKLKSQLHELEQYAFESGEAGLPPQDIILERQRIILNEVKHRLNLHELDEDKLHRLSPAELREHVDIALGHLVNPLKMKEHLVSQLKTQVADLERFINYLQQASEAIKNDGGVGSKCACGCSLHSVGKQSMQKDTVGGMVQRTAVLLQMFALLQMGCGGNPNAGGRPSSGFKMNDLKRTMKVNHYGDLRARLEMAIIRVQDLLKKSSSLNHPNNSNPYCDQGDYSSDSDSPTVLCNVQLTTAVRKHLATSIKDLIEHGTYTTDGHGGGGTIVPFIGCFQARRTEVYAARNGAGPGMHAWELILEYYELKNGDRFNSMPARKLSQSFNLEIAGATATSSKQNMLCAIGGIIATHARYKRTYDSHFKAFICAALNANKLVTWLGLLFQSKQLLNMHYESWSYVAKTGFQDSLQSLDRLSHCKFDLPVDLAIRQFQNIKDVFT